MRVQLAYAYTDADGATHDPDDVIDVDDDEGRRLITEGRARVPDGEAAPPSMASTTVSAGRLAGADIDSANGEALQREIRARNAEGADLKVSGSVDELRERLHEDDAERA